MLSLFSKKDLRITEVVKKNCVKGECHYLPYRPILQNDKKRYKSECCMMGKLKLQALASTNVYIKVRN